MVQDQLPQFLFIIVKDLGKSGQCRLQVAFPVPHDLLGVQDQIIDLLAGGQKGPVPVHDIAPLVGDHPAVILLLGQHDLGIIFFVDLDDIIEYQDQCKQSQRDHHHSDRQLFLHIRYEQTWAVLFLLFAGLLSVSGYHHTALHTRFPSCYR